MKKSTKLALTVAALSIASTAANADCKDITTYEALRAATETVVQAGTTGGFSLPSWATIVDHTGRICYVANSGGSGHHAGNKQWLGSRVISAQKANTANAFSLDGVSISTGALYAAVQPGGSLYGLQHSNPVDASRAYIGGSHRYGLENDPLVGKRIGGVNVFGGGIALYNSDGIKVGAIGVSGDTSCTDHANAWRIREALGLDNTPGGFEALDLVGTYTALGHHPHCYNDAGIDDVAADGFSNI